MISRAALTLVAILAACGLLFVSIDALAVSGLKATCPGKGSLCQPVPAAGGCSGSDTLFTSAGANSFTSTCTGSLDVSAWGGGASGGGNASPSDPGGGAGAFGKGHLAVTNGHVYFAVVGAGHTGSTTDGISGTISYFCDSSVAACQATGISGVTLTTCSGTGLNTGNFVCADFGVGAGSGSPSGGVAANSVGGTSTANGGSGGSGSATCAGGAGGGGGGGSGGPDGAGANGANTGATGGNGGTADNGSGGAGGTGTAGGAAGNGGTDTTHGGGGGGGTNTGTAGAGGAPGGGGGGGCSVAGAAGIAGQVTIHPAGP